MVLKTMWQRHKILAYLKSGLIDKGYNFKSLSYINAQLEILDALIKEESFDVLNRLLFEKTNYRLLKQIDKGQENLVSIIDYPEQWKLCKVSEHCNEWVNKDSLIFSTEREILCFTKNDYGQKYISNKWQ